MKNKEPNSEPNQEPKPANFKFRVFGSKLLCLALFASLEMFAQYRPALPGYHYLFPRDHFNHPEFQTEWWYYTGNLRSSDGRAFGFELTFFRQAVSRGQPQDSPWNVEDLYIAHLALSDLDGRRFYHLERVNRAGPGLAGASEKAGRIWNGNWHVEGEGGGQKLQAIGDRFSLRLSLESRKPPVIHGVNGISQKAEGAGRASHYISFTRLLTQGSIELEGKNYQVQGASWMDHEFFTPQKGEDLSGWDWLSIQLAGNTELMLYRLRRADKAPDPYSSGTYVDEQGRPTHLGSGDFALEPAGEMWTSPRTGGVYPISWRISIPSLNLHLQTATPLKTQEVVSAGMVPNYWEGAIRLSGTKNNVPINGEGYLEMTGYDKPFSVVGP